METVTLKSLESEVLEMVRNRVILRPDQPALILARSIFHENFENAALLHDLAELLALRYLAAAINTERRKAKPQPEVLPLFPGLEHLPRRIVTAEGKRPLLAKSTATEIRAYVKSLNAKHRERIAELQKVLGFMGRYTRENRGLTAAQVASLLETE